MNGCLESLATLRTLTKLTLALAKEQSIPLEDITPHISTLQQLELLHIGGVEIYKQDLQGAAPLAKLQRLKHLEIRGQVLPLATFLTLVSAKYSKWVSQLLCNVPSLPICLFTY